MTGNLPTRLLVIEDDEIYRSILVEMLVDEGYEVDSAASGTAGVELAQQHVPDLVLCDIMMTGMDGYSVLAALRRSPQTATIPVVFLTGLGAKAAVRKGMDSGADDYLVKPVAQDDLLRAVRARLERCVVMRRDIQERLNDLRADLAQSLPHEFLTPLTAVMGLSSLLVDQDPSDVETVREIAHGIFVGSQDLQDIVRKFLLYAELQSEETSSSVPISSARAAVVIREAAAAKAARVERSPDLALEIEETPVPLAKDNLQPLVEELVENAFKFSAVGSPVMVRCGGDGNDWKLSVSDRGRGLTPEQLAGLETRLPFSRRHNAQPGVGLGLVIVRRLIRLHDGTMDFETVPGQGTTVHVRIPPRE